MENLIHSFTELRAVLSDKKAHEFKIISGGSVFVRETVRLAKNGRVEVIDLDTHESQWFNSLEDFGRPEVLQEGKLVRVT